MPNIFVHNNKNSCEYYQLLNHKIDIGTIARMLDFYGYYQFTSTGTISMFTQIDTLPEEGQKSVWGTLFPTQVVNDKVRRGKVFG